MHEDDLRGQDVCRQLLVTGANCVTATTRTRPPDELALHRDPEDAAALALYDDAGAYRPLKTAPNLRHGWRLVVPDEAALRTGAGLVLSRADGGVADVAGGRLVATPLRETLGRQTGMYRVTAKITDEQADALVGRFCRSDGGCLRTILWRRDAAGTVASTRLPPEKFDPARDQAGRRGESLCRCSVRKRAICSWPRRARW